MITFCHPPPVLHALSSLQSDWRPVKNDWVPWSWRIHYTDGYHIKAFKQDREYHKSTDKAYVKRIPCNGGKPFLLISSFLKVGITYPLSLHLKQDIQSFPPPNPFLIQSEHQKAGKMVNFSPSVWIPICQVPGSSSWTDRWTQTSVQKDPHISSLSSLGLLIKALLQDEWVPSPS